MLTNVELIDYVEQVYLRKWVYWYGTVGYPCTLDLYKNKRKQYPKYYTDARKAGYMADIKAEATCCDCVGMIKSFFWKDGDIDAATRYDGEGKRTGCPDVSANGMIDLCQDKGPISSLPEVPGLVVWRSGHIGVYVGDGYTIEARGFAYDVQKRKLTDGTWTKWGRLPFLEYVDSPTPEYHLGDRTLRRGDVGEDVRELQLALLSLGYSLPKYGADGDYGSETVRAVQAFQIASELDPDGVFGPATYKALMAALHGHATDSAGEGAPDGGSEAAQQYQLVIIGGLDELTAIQQQFGGVLSERVD